MDKLYTHNEIIKRILKILRSYKNKSYFNIFFYAEIKDLLNYDFNGCVYSITDIEDYEYMFIYDMLDRYSKVYPNTQQFSKQEYIINLFYKLTHYDKIDKVLNRHSLGFVPLCNSYFNFFDGFFLINQSGKIKKQYMLHIDNNSVINCIDNSNDDINFQILYGTKFKDKVNKKKFNQNDIELLNILIDDCYSFIDFMDNFTINDKFENRQKLIINYCLAIINYKQKGINLVKRKLMQRNIYMIIMIIVKSNEYIFKSNKYVVYLTELFKYLYSINYMVKLIIDDGLPIKYYKYINKKRIVKLINKIMSDYRDTQLPTILNLTNVLSSIKEDKV